MNAWFDFTAVYLESIDQLALGHHVLIIIV